MMDIFIWKCSCGYVELWEELASIKEDPRRHFNKECPKCKGIMDRHESLKGSLLNSIKATLEIG